MGLEQRPTFKTPDPKECAKGISMRVKAALKALESANNDRGPNAERTGLSSRTFFRRNNV